MSPGVSKVVFLQGGGRVKSEPPGTREGWEAPRHDQNAPHGRIRLASPPAANLGESPIKPRKTSAKQISYVRQIARGGWPYRVFEGLDFQERGALDIRNHHYTSSEGGYCSAGNIRSARSPVLRNRFLFLHDYTQCRNQTFLKSRWIFGTHHCLPSDNHRSPPPLRGP